MEMVSITTSSLIEDFRVQTNIIQTILTMNDCGCTVEQSTLCSVSITMYSCIQNNNFHGRAHSACQSWEIMEPI